MNFKVNNVAAWDDVADEIIKNLSYPIILLKGNLGAGKTTFTKSLVKKLGSDDEVSSPTYAIVNEYNTPKGKIYHFDLYRMKHAAEVMDIGIEEYLENAWLCIIEWPEVYEDELQGLSFHEMVIANQENYRDVSFV